MTYESYARAPIVWPTVMLLLLVVLGAPLAAMGLYLLLLSVAALFYSDPVVGTDSPATRVVVLVPAHDEAVGIARCVKSLRDQSYPRDQYQIAVIADNCTDDTAALARKAGADHVMMRHAPEARGKGQALRWAIDQVLTWWPVAEAIVVVDADASADRDLIKSLVRKFEAGADVVQGLNLTSSDDGEGETVRPLAHRLMNDARQAGRAVLGLQAYLGGNGMLLGRQTLLEVPWTAFTACEDLEYGLMLEIAGASVRFAPDAAVVSPSAPDARSARQQQIRYFGGRALLVRRWLPQLVTAALRRRRPALLLSALDLAVPPLSLLVAGVTALMTVTFAAVLLQWVSPWALAPCLVAVASIFGAVLIGLRAANTPAGTYKALARAPAYVLKSVLRLPQILAFRGDTWVRTERKVESQ